MSAARLIALTAPLAGWSTPLEEAPDEVFAGRMLGDGVAVDPLEGLLRAPCAAEVLLVAPTRHAVTLRTEGGCQILLHVGIDTVALKGEGFEARARQGERVRAGDPLLAFDLDLIARRARSALTPIIVTADSGFILVRSCLDRRLAPGDLLMELAPAGRGALSLAADAAAAPRVRQVPVALEHGIHARPAALLAASLQSLAADARLRVRGREANARSPVALMALGVQHGEQVEIRVTGPDAGSALDALAAVLGTGAALPARKSGPRAAAAAEPPAVAPAPAGVLRGVIASAGLAVGEALRLRRPEIAVAQNGAGADTENAALDRARAVVRARLERRAAPGGDGPQAAREIAAAHRQLLDDPELVAAARALMAEGRSAAFAWRSAVRASAAVLQGLEDALLRERADDLLDLETQVLLELCGAAPPAAPHFPAHAILVAHELLPSQLADLGGVSGICMAAGGPTSHASILAAAMGVPALVALGPALLALEDGTPLVLDAERGTLEVSPTAARVAEARAELERRTARRERLKRAAQTAARTADGTRIEVLANIGSLAEAHAAIANGAEGCGLLRTEFLFLDRQSAPGEQEQAAEYQRIADVLGERPLTIRTLDAGGDKPIAYLPLPAEENPALGLRGVRTSLAYPELLATQLRAVLAVRGRCRLLLPMVTDVAEVQAVRAQLAALAPERQHADPVQVGVMIETPAAAVLAGRLAAVADFLSIGTNDLTQYTLAIDRGHPQLAPRLDALHPAVLQLIAASASAARAHGRHAAVCGGLASEPLAAPLLIGLGVDELSVVPAVVPQLKARIAQLTLGECRALAARALEAADAPAVRELLRRAAGPEDAP